MQALLAIPAMLSSAGAAVASGASAVGGAIASGASAVSGALSASSGALGAIKMGTTALSALQGFGMANNQAANAETQAQGERMAASQEYLQANQNSQSLLRQYDRVTGSQLSAASGMGVDIGSGSVVAAQQLAQTETDRQLGVLRTGAAMNASLRLARAAALQQSAGVDRISGIMGGLTKIGTGALQMAQGGVPGSGS